MCLMGNCVVDLCIILCYGDYVDLRLRALVGAREFMDGSLG